jgi:hypothetical protein
MNEFQKYVQARAVARNIKVEMGDETEWMGRPLVLGGVEFSASCWPTGAVYVSTFNPMGQGLELRMQAWVELLRELLEGAPEPVFGSEPL